MKRHDFKTRSLADILFVRNRHVCPRYCCFSFDNIARKLLQKPEVILKDTVKPASRVLDIGAGQGYFSIPMAKMVGREGKVFAIDIQENMLAVLRKRAEKARVPDRIECRLVTDTCWGLHGEMDFALAFWVVHEVPDKEPFIRSVYTALKPGGRFLVVEPFLHVTANMFEATRSLCEKSGFAVIARPAVFFSRSLLFRKPEK